MSLCKSARKLRGPLSYSFAQKISVINNNLTQLLFFNKIMKYYKSIFLGYMNSASLSTTMQNPQLKEFTNQVRNMKIHLVLCGEIQKVVYITTSQVQRGKLPCRSVGHGKNIYIYKNKSNCDYVNIYCNSFSCHHETCDAKKVISTMKILMSNLFGSLLNDHVFLHLENNIFRSGNLSSPAVLHNNTVWSHILPFLKKWQL